MGRTYSITAEADRFAANPLLKWSPRLGAGSGANDRPSLLHAEARQADGKPEAEVLQNSTVRQVSRYALTWWDMVFHSPEKDGLHWSVYPGTVAQFHKGHELHGAWWAPYSARISSSRMLIEQLLQVMAVVYGRFFCVNLNEDLLHLLSFIRG